MLREQTAVAMEADTNIDSEANAAWHDAIGEKQLNQVTQNFMTVHLVHRYTHHAPRKVSSGSRSRADACSTNNEDDRDSQMGSSF